MTSLLAQTEQTEPLVQALWPLLLLTSIGVVGVVLLALVRRQYRRHRRLTDRSPMGDADPKAETDVWSESARRLDTSQEHESRDD